MVIIEKSGALTTIQDMGRTGYERFGVSPAGPMDIRSFVLANLLVGNPKNTAAMEISIIGPTLRFTERGIIAITGCDIAPRRQGKLLEMYKTIEVEAGDVIQMGIAPSGCRAYLAIAGGFAVPKVMGSCATSVQNKIGGKDGRKLKNGDELQVGQPTVALDRLAGRSFSKETFGQKQPVTIQVIMGPQDKEFTDSGINTFLNSTYTVGNDSNRMGYRLEGPVIEHKGDGNIISDGIVTGSVQVPTAGLPIIMLAERQTVGGYTKIATVISADLPKIGQCRPGDTIRFQAVSIDEAQRLYQDMQDNLKQKEIALSSGNRSRTYKIEVNGKPYLFTVEER